MGVILHLNDGILIVVIGFYLYISLNYISLWTMLLLLMPAELVYSEN